MRELFVGPETAGVLGAGPLGKHVDGFVEALVQTGYAQATMHAKVLVLVQLGQWLERRSLRARDLDGRGVGEFLGWRRRRYQACRGAETTVVQLIDHLRSTGELAPVVLPGTRGGAAVIEEQYATYLREERALARATLLNYLPLVDRFLADRFADRPILLDQIKADDVTRFVLRRAHAMSPGRAKLLVTTLRSFLRFLFLRGETEIDLTPSVPSVADWRLAKLPKFIPAEEVHRLLGACDRRRGGGTMPCCSC